MGRQSQPLTFEPETTLSDLFRAIRDATDTTVNTSDVITSTTQESVTASASPNSTLTLPAEGHNSTFASSPEPPNSTFTLTSKILNVTSTMATTTEPQGINSTSTANDATTAVTGDGDESSMGGTIAAAVITVVLVMVFIAAMVYVYMRRTRNPHQKSAICFQPIKKRRSSTSDSRRTLEEIDVEDPDKMADHHDDRPNGGSGNRRSSKRQNQEELDAFTIDDLEEPEDDVTRGDEYYYDEVFGHSQFEDEATQNAVRQLYSSTGDDQREEELLDFDFETLGIKIEDYKIDPSRRALEF